MGKVNRFMPTNECNFLEAFEGGEIYWFFVEDEVKNLSRLTITFIRNAADIQDERISRRIKEIGLSHLLSGKSDTLKKTGVFEELEFWHPHFEDIPTLLQSAKDMFKLRLIQIDSKKLKTSIM